MKLWGNKKNAAVYEYDLLGADMHSHLLPGIDDGSPDMETSLHLIRGLKELGFKKLITTPHVMQDMYPNTREEILRSFESLKKNILAAGIQIELGVAAEYFLDDNLKQLLANKEQLLSFGDGLVLVEFSMASEPIDFKELLFEMQMQGYQPVIAHPERYVYHERNKEFFEQLKIAGYLFQLNIMSLAGAYGRSVNELAKYFIKKQYYDLAGTDLHNAHHLEYLHNSSITHGLKELMGSGNLLNMDL